MHYSGNARNFLQAAKCSEEMAFLLELHSIRDEWELWAEKEKLLAYEAIPLMNGVDPRSWQEYVSGEKKLRYELVQSIKRCLDIAEHEGLVVSTPSEWLAWGRVHGLDKLMLKSQQWVRQPDVCMWSLFEFAVNNGRTSETEETKIIESESPDFDEEIADLFDPVSHQVLSTVFPSKNKSGNDRWSQWHRKAKQCGLDKARQGRGMYNPYRAAKWWIDKYKPEGWDWSRCMRVLTNKCLPARSIDHKYSLTNRE